MWKRHWKLARDPFLDGVSPFVPLPSHTEAVARLVETVVTGRKLALLRAAAGTGKSRALTQALAETRSPSRRVAKLSAPADGPSLLAASAEALGARVPAGAPRSIAWRTLGEAIRLCRWQRLHVILAIDDCHNLVEPGDRLDLDRLAHADPHPSSRLTVLQVHRIDEPASSDPGTWELAIRLPRLTRGETEQYLVSKLSASGRDEPAFTPRALHRLHALSEGVPRGLDRLATLAMMAGAVRGLEIITPEVVEGVSLECLGVPSAI